MLHELRVSKSSKGYMGHTARERYCSLRDLTKHLEVASIFKRSILPYLRKGVLWNRGNSFNVTWKRLVIFVALIWSKQKIVAILSHLATTRLWRPDIFLVVAPQKNTFQRTP